MRAHRACARSTKIPCDERSANSRLLGLAHPRKSARRCNQRAASFDYGGAFVRQRCHRKACRQLRCGVFSGVNRRSDEQLWLCARDVLVRQDEDLRVDWVGQSITLCGVERSGGADGYTGSVPTQLTEWPPSSPFPSHRMIPDRSSPSRVRFAASRPGPLRVDLERRAVHEGKGGMQISQ